MYARNFPIGKMSAGTPAALHFAMDSTSTVDDIHTHPTPQCSAYHASGSPGRLRKRHSQSCNKPNTFPPAVSHNHKPKGTPTSTTSSSQWSANTQQIPHNTHPHTYTAHPSHLSHRTSSRRHAHLRPPAALEPRADLNTGARREERYFQPLPPRAQAATWVSG